MSKTRKIIIIISLIMGILFLNMTKNYAENEVEEPSQGENITQTPTTTSPEGTNTGNEPSTENTGSTQTTENEPSTGTTSNGGSSQGGTAGSTGNSNQSTSTNHNTNSSKSNNTFLTSLGIRPYDFKGFNNNNTTYDVTVPENVEEVEVYATTQDKKATLEGVGMKTLQKGKNVAEVTVIAQDGTRKTFTINIIREEENSENEQVPTTDDKEEGLKKLDIKGQKLSPEFQSDIYEYRVKYIGKDAQLEFEVQPTDDNYIVEITGNENLQEGENIITILVSKSNGDNVATYQVIVDKSLVDEEAIARQEAEEKENQRRMIIGTVVAVGIIAIIVFIFIKKRKIKDDDDYLDFSIYKDDYDEDENNSEMPKALQKRKDNEDIIVDDRSKDEDSDDEDFDKMPRNKVKEKFLDGYLNSEEQEDLEEDELKSSKHTGKRFK